MNGGAAEREHRQDVAAQAVADHAHAISGDAELAKNAVVGAAVLLEQDFDVAEVMRQPAGLDLVCLVNEIALGDQHHPMMATDVRQYLGDIGK